MRASRSTVLCVLAVTAGLCGCGGTDDPPPTTTEGPPLQGLQARRNRAPAVLAAVERAIGADHVVDLTFDRRRYTILTSWVTRQQHDSPASTLEADSDVRDDRGVASACRAIERIDPDADAYVAAYNGTSWRIDCPQNRRSGGR